MYCPKLKRILLPRSLARVPGQSELLRHITGSAAERSKRFHAKWRVAVMNPLVYYAGLYAASAALLKLAGFVCFLWLARTLSVEAYATWGLLYALQTAISSFALAGIVEAVIGSLRTHRAMEEQGRLFAAANSVFIIASVLCVFLATAVFVGFFANGDNSFTTIIWVLLSGGLLAHSSLQAQIVRLGERHLASLYFNFLVPFSGLFGSVLAFAYLRVVEAFYWGFAVGLLVPLAAARVCRLGFYGLALSMTQWRPILLRISPFIAVTFLGWLSGYGNNYVIKLAFEAADVARFTLAFMLSTIMQLIASAMNQTWGPRFFRIVHDQPFYQVEKQNRRFFGLQAIVLGFAGGLLVALYPAGMRLLGGNLMYYQSMTLEVFLLMLSYVCLVPYWHCQNYLLAHDKGQSVMRMHIVTSLIGFAALLLLMLLLGPLGIYVGFLAQMLLRTGGAVIIAKKHWPLEFNVLGVATGAVFVCLGFLVSGLI